ERLRDHLAQPRLAHELLPRQLGRGRGARAAGELRRHRRGRPLVARRQRRAAADEQRGEEPGERQPARPHAATRLPRTSVRTSTKKTGTKKIASKVPVTVPPTMPVPIDTRLLAPAPVDTASGITPATNARDVITIGRSRSRAPVTAASTRLAPRWYAASANSRIRIAFF